MCGLSNREIELQALITEREGMIAGNLQRQAEGNSMLYMTISFLELADQIRELKEE